MPRVGRGWPWPARMIRMSEARLGGLLLDFHFFGSRFHLDLDFHGGYAIIAIGIPRFFSRFRESATPQKMTYLNNCHVSPSAKFHTKHITRYTKNISQCWNHKTRSLYDLYVTVTHLFDICCFNL